MQLARAVINDMLRSAAGQILTNKANFSIAFLNSAIRRTQRYLANRGLENFINDNVILSAISPVQSADPGVQCYIGANGYFDGVNINAQPVLPVDLILPLAVWERQSNSAGTFTPVHPTDGDGLPSQQPLATFGQYEWRNDRINVIGATNTTDMRIRYEASIPTIAAGTDLAVTTIPLRDCHEALAFWVIHYYALSRGSAQRTEMAAAAKEAMDEVLSRHVRKDERIAIRPQGYGQTRGRF